MLMSLEAVAHEIKQGKWLALAGSETLLRKLPRGQWIGGTIPYFMGQNGGEQSNDKIFVQTLATEIQKVDIKFYTPETISSVAEDAPDNGFTLLLIPANSQVHLDYAANATDYPEMFFKPIAGWITGVHLDDLGQQTPKVFHGETGEISENSAVALHASLPSNIIAQIGIVNPFEQGEGDIITFPNSGFSVTDALIAGKKINFADYLKDNNINTQLPLVADYDGAMINVSVQEVDEKNKTTRFYAPVFENVAYHFAKPMPDYPQAFQNSLPNNIQQITFSCNCILNYLYSELEGKKTANMTGPITFGEIAYQLLNQTLVYLNIEKL